ncbi:tripeptidyl-peptidase 1-like [Xiphophorus hellerii]|uniref:tripeptidyl-peptidase 1-like n=1 Tax=Xiphophorus hellerii TaxID=8084 RepID=UPI0013B386CB|nr:tripeptidyl-peptidase 1-like [Xiphophorus hellerii]
MNTIFPFFVPLLFGSLVSSGFLEYDQNVILPQDWTQAGQVDPSEQLELTFALKQQNVDLLEETLRRVSDPDSPQYGKHLSLQEVSSLVRPSALTQKVLHRWLQTHGISNCRTVRTQDFLQCSMTAEVAEALLPGSRFHRYVRDGRSIVRSSSPYSVHDEVHQHLDFVGGLHRVPPKGKDANRKRPRSKAGVHLGVTPAVLRTRYNLTATDVGSAENNSQAVAQVGKPNMEKQRSASMYHKSGTDFQKTKSRSDVGNFDKEFTKMAVELTPTDKLFIMNLDQNEFQGFSYTNPEFVIQV